MKTGLLVAAIILIILSIPLLFRAIVFGDLDSGGYAALFQSLGLSVAFIFAWLNED